MLINFSVQNFGSIKDKQTLSFEADKSEHLEDYYVIHTNGLRLLKLGLIYGANASGKTTILKALDFVRTLVLNPKSQKTETFDFTAFLFDKTTPKENTIFETDFLQNDVRYCYEVEMNRKAIVREELYAYSPKKSNVFKRTTDLENQITNIEFGSKIKIKESAKNNLEQLTLWNNTVLSGFLKINLEQKELKDTTDWFHDFMLRVVYPWMKFHKFVTDVINRDESYKNIVLGILQKADFNISNIVVKNGGENISNVFMDIQSKQESILKDKKISSDVNLEFEHVVNDKFYSLPFKQESLGTQRYYELAGLLPMLIAGQIILPIDELESSLHPDLFQHFLLSFLVNSKKSQLIATTHNREILCDRDIFRPDALWITDKDNENLATELYSFADFGSSVVRKDTSSYYNAYKMGKLGGTPNLGSYYINIDDENE
ncbi:MAG: ATP-binding protein [Bacteroidales bacterium]|jgi:AAA15 family ATPase/GTPase|nr:ATP-binding protein [Bacteroidales bacterium]